MVYYKKRIEVLTLIPGFVDTNMTKFIENRKNIVFAPVDACVKTCLRDLGYESESFGAFTHEVQGTIATKLKKWIGAYQFSDISSEEKGSKISNQ